MPDVEPQSSQAPDWAAQALAAEFTPLPQVGLLQSVRRYWLLALLPIVVFVAVAVVIASKRTPTYTAEARLMVAGLNISSPGAVQGFAGAAQDLAASYPLVIDADGVVNPVARRLHTTPGDVRSRLSASQVPSSSLVRVIATGSSAGDAIQLANTASKALVSFLVKFNRDAPDAARLLAQLRAAELAYQHANAVLVTARANSPLSASAPPTRSEQKLAAAADLARIKLNGLQADYQNELQGQAVSSLLQPLVSAQAASSDRHSKLQITVFIALISGLFVGLGLATLRANWVARRMITAPAWHADDSS